MVELKEPGPLKFQFTVPLEPVTVASKLPRGLPATKAREVGEMLMEGATATVTLTSLVTLPALLLAVRVKVWLAVMLRVLLPLSVGVTLPTLWLMLRVVAPLTSYSSFTLPPPVGRLEGLAVQLLILGGVVVPPGVQAASNPNSTFKNLDMV